MTRQPTTRELNYSSNQLRKHLDIVAQFQFLRSLMLRTETVALYLGRKKYGIDADVVSANEAMMRLRDRTRSMVLSKVTISVAGSRTPPSSLPHTKPRD